MNDHWTINGKGLVKMQNLFWQIIINNMRFFSGSFKITRLVSEKKETINRNVNERFNNNPSQVLNLYY